MVVLFIGLLIASLCCGGALSFGTENLVLWIFALGGEIFALWFIGHSISNNYIDSDDPLTKVMSIIGTVFWVFGITVVVPLDTVSIVSSALIVLLGLFIAPYFIVVSLYAFFEDSKVAKGIIGGAKVSSSILLYRSDLKDYLNIKDISCSPKQWLAFFIIVSALVLLSFVLIILNPTVHAIVEKKKRCKEERQARKRCEEEQRKISCSNQLIFAAGNNDKDAVLNLLSQGADVNYKDSSGRTPLLRSVKNNHKDMVSFLFESGANVDNKDFNSKTTLDYAIENENEDMILLLLENGADMYFSYDDKPLLFVAIEKNYTKLATWLIEKGVHKKATFDDDDIKKITPLLFALQKHNKDMVLLLLKHKAEVNVGAKYNGFLVCPLQGVVRGGDKEFAEILIENGADVNFDNGMTPLMFAIENNDKDMVSFLLENGANVNFKTSLTKTNPVETTPLAHAIDMDKKEIALFLIEKGADVNLKNSHGYCSLNDAIFDDNVDMASFLIEKGADVNATDKKNVSLLQHAIIKKNKKMVSILLDAGADVNRNSSKMETALQDAIDIKNYDSEIVSLLIEKGADVNLESVYNGHTPLTLAVAQNNKDAVSLLLEKGADLNKKSSRFDAPLMIAFQAANREMVSLLMENGADSSDVFCTSAIMPTTEVAEFLLSKGADVNCEGLGGFSPLCSAVSFGGKEMALFLISNGADVNHERSTPSEKKSARTPLEFAIVTGNAEMVSLLITYGADVNYETQNGNTPLTFAALHGKSEIVPILKEAGAIISASSKNKSARNSSMQKQSDSNLSENSEDFNVALVALSKIIAKNGAEIFSSENNQKLKALVLDFIPDENEFAETLKDALSCDFSHIIFDATDKDDHKRGEVLKKSIDKIVSETSVERNCAVLIAKLVALSLDWNLENMNLK